MTVITPDEKLMKMSITTHIKSLLCLETKTPKKSDETRFYQKFENIFKNPLQWPDQYEMPKHLAQKNCTFWSDQHTPKSVHGSV